MELYLNNLYFFNLNSFSYNPSVFASPSEFLPSRWSSQPFSDAFQFLPFSAGSRNCIGQNLAMVEIQVMIVAFLLKFQFQSLEDKRLKMKLDFTLGPEDDEFVQVTGN
jgi:cytochrome P450